MGLLDFLALPGQERTRLRDEYLGGLLNYYLGPTGIPERLVLPDMMNPTSDAGRSMTSSQEMLAPGRTPRERFDAGVSMLTDIASVAAPSVATRMAGGDAAQSVVEGLLGTPMAVEEAGRRVAERLNQPGPVPTMYSNPFLSRAAGERYTMRGDDYFAPANPAAGRAKDPALFSPYSATKHTMAPNEFVVSGTDLGVVSPAQVVTPSELQQIYDRVYFATGDRTSANRVIDEINDVVLREPAATYGGPEYMDSLRSWASEPSAMSAKANALQEVPGDVRSLLAYMPMGERSGDFSKHMSDVYGALTQSVMAGNRGPGPENIKAIDALISTKFPQLEDVPSVASEQFSDWLSGLKGGQRAQLIKAFDAADFKALGMPDVSAARFAVTNPDLVASDALSVGYRMSEPDASSGAIRSAEHPSYGAYLPMAEGTQSMTLGFEVPWWIGARDTALQKIQPGGVSYALPKDIKSYMGNPRLYQNLDQQWVDEVSTYGGLLADEGRQAADAYATGLLDSIWRSR